MEDVRVEDINELIRRKFAFENQRNAVLGRGFAPVQHVDICVTDAKKFEEIAQALEKTPTVKYRRDEGPDAVCVEYACCTFWCDMHNRKRVV